jgi:hypothetical protein
MVFCGNSHETQSQSINVNSSQKLSQEIETEQQPNKFLKRLQKAEYANILQNTTWTLIHDYSDSKKVDIVLKVFAGFLKTVEDYENKPSEKANSIDEYNKFKDKLISWTKDKDQSIRAFASTLIGITGDKSLIDNLLNLLNEKKTKESEFEIVYDRRQAAIAIGLLGAKEHSQQLIKLLSSSNTQDKIGGLYGLAFLKSKESIIDIEKLLKDEDEDVRKATQEVLKMIKSN